MPYDPALVQPMREDLTRIGVKELSTADEVDRFMAETKGTAMLIVNSVCGCAAAQARPGVAEAWQKSAKKPENAITVFAGNDREATAQARSYFTGYAPSSPSIALIKDGDVVFMLERYQISGRDATEIGKDLATAFEQYC